MIVLIIEVFYSITIGYRGFILLEEFDDST